MNRIRRIFYTVCLLLFPTMALPQFMAIKTDLSNWATLSLNIEPEFRLGDMSTLAVGISYNPWSFANNVKWKHLRIQPEYRIWFGGPFGVNDSPCRWIDAKDCDDRNTGAHFIGIHASYTRFNVGGLRLPLGIFPRLETQRCQGNEYAIGVGYGYHWVLSDHWSFEAEIGVGFSHAVFDYYEKKKCGIYLGKETTNRIVPTKVGLSIAYLIGN